MRQNLHGGTPPWISSSTKECHNIHHCTPWDKTLLETESGKTYGRYYKQPAIHLSGLRDCKTLLVGDAPLGLGSGYKDLCNKGSTDQRTKKQ
jgi:hypothetical protein